MRFNQLISFAALMLTAGFFLTVLPGCERTIGDDSFDIAEEVDEADQEGNIIEDNREIAEMMNDNTGGEEITP